MTQPEELQSMTSPYSITELLSLHPIDILGHVILHCGAVLSILGYSAMVAPFPPVCDD